MAHESAWKLRELPHALGRYHSRIATELLGHRSLQRASAGGVSAVHHARASQSGRAQSGQAHQTIAGPALRAFVAPGLSHRSEPQRVRKQRQPARVEGKDAEAGREALSGDREWHC